MPTHGSSRAFSGATTLSRTTFGVTVLIGTFRNNVLLTVVILNTVMLSIVMLSAVMLSAVMLSAVLLQKLELILHSSLLKVLLCYWWCSCLINYSAFVGKTLAYIARAAAVIPIVLLHWICCFSVVMGRKRKASLIFKQRLLLRQFWCSINVKNIAILLLLFISVDVYWTWKLTGSRSLLQN